MSLKENINKDLLPSHIAIIMDGNGRWAKKHGKVRISGHREGGNTVRKIVEAAGELGVNYLTLYTFSTENWNRSSTEIEALMTLLVRTISSETNNLMKNNVRLTAIGDLERLPKTVKRKLDGLIGKTFENTGLTLVLALSYSSRWEIVEAVKSIAEKVKKGEIEAENIDENLFSAHLTTKDIPDPELLIRTSGEYRISNYLLWQIAYTELYFSSKFWPEFSKEDFYEAILDYQNRERRFGKTSEQLSK